MLDINRWLDAYELELALRDNKESPDPRVLWHAWYQKWKNGRDDGHWYPFGEINE